MLPIMLLAAFVLPLTLVDSQQYDENRCDINQQYYECKPCTDGCDGPMACPKICEPGCDCSPGFVLQSKEPRICVKKEQCIYCREPNQVYSQCYGHCPATCDVNKICLMICKPGCVCVEGMVLHNGKCIPLSECPKTGQQYNN
ncbi:von Willebrand factor-like [Spea bombifrons]|uniref:von Willebrand factor-like n=1 Tax=Spea bombifrons TaxID=233779 RepID=UPI002348F2BB|nr:von Willebrand factor-like [Spea bombifrons]